MTQMMEPIPAARRTATTDEDVMRLLAHEGADARRRVRALRRERRNQFDPVGLVARLIFGGGRKKKVAPKRSGAR